MRKNPESFPKFPCIYRAELLSVPPSTKIFPYADSCLQCHTASCFSPVSFSGNTNTTEAKKLHLPCLIYSEQSYSGTFATSISTSSLSSITQLTCSITGNMQCICKMIVIFWWTEPLMGCADEGKSHYTITTSWHFPCFWPLHSGCVRDHFFMDPTINHSVYVHPGVLQCKAGAVKYEIKEEIRWWFYPQAHLLALWLLIFI